MIEAVNEMFQDRQEYEHALLECVRDILGIYVADCLPVSENGQILRTGGIYTEKEELLNLLEETSLPEETLRRMEDARQRLLLVRDKGRSSMRGGVIIPMEYLLHAFGLTDFEAYMVILTWAGETDRNLGTLFAVLNGRTGIRVPTMNLCIRTWEGRSEERILLFGQCVEHWQNLAFLFSGMYEECRRVGQTCADGFLELGLKLEHRIVSWLQDYNSLDPALEGMVQYEYRVNDEMLIQEQLAEGIFRTCIGMEHPGALFLWGDRGAGKKYQVAWLCRRRGMGLLLIDTKKLPEDGERLGRILYRIMRESRLRGNAAICFCDLPCVEQEDMISQMHAELLLEGMRFWNGDIFLTSEYGWNGKIQNFGRKIQKIRLPETTTEERIALWQSFLKPEELPENLNLEFLSDKYVLSPGSIRNSAEDYRNRMRLEGGAPGKRWLLEACRQQIDHRLGKDAVRIPVHYTWEDLVLPGPQKKMLRDACNQVLYHHQVYHRWGFEQKLAYGRGVSMIFYGPPGTGKTMAAQVIANELDLELYKVDMAGVMSKYVGESEKKLGNIFEQAGKSQSILFFDEADVLFGKRTDQKDSNDKYANASTAYLLQKIEEYEGIMILATNLLQNFDNAFLRRFKFLIEFPFTDAERRLEIWKKVFPQDTPREELDFPYLAEEFKFSGSQIKNAAVAAAFLAAGEQTEVGMRHVLIAVKREMSKTGKTLVTRDFGPYYYLMEEE